MIWSENPKIEIFCADWRDHLPGYLDESFDLLIGDPPYGIGKTWNKSPKDIFYKYNGGTYFNDQPPTPAEIKQLIRVAKNYVLWGYNYYAHALPQTNNLIIWDKKRNYKKSHLSEAEIAAHNFNQPARIYTQQWDGGKKGSENGKCNKIHPHQKPINLYKWILQEYLPAGSGAVIVDPYFGSGSIAIACHEMGFDLIGFERDPDIYQAAHKRFLQHTAQLKINIK